MNVGSNANIAVVAGQNATIQAENLRTGNGAKVAMIAGASNDMVSQIATTVVSSAFQNIPPHLPLQKDKSGGNLETHLQIVLTSMQTTPMWNQIAL